MAAPLMNEVARDYVTDGVPSSGPHEIRKPDLRAWGSWIEQIVTAFTSNGGLIYSSKALLDADLAKDANRMAWVLGDPVAANNGVYRKIGASGTGSWTRASDLPFSFIVAADTGAGTPNAIQATTAMPVSGSALVLLNIFEENTASPVTVSFNGEAALTVKSNSGNDIVAGGLQSGMLVMGRVSGSTFRLVSDQVSAAIVAAAEAAQVAAEIEAARAEAAASAASALAENGYIVAFGVVGNGSTDDTAAMASLENSVKGKSVNLLGKTVVVASIPAGNDYYNGAFKIGAEVYRLNRNPRSHPFDNGTGLSLQVVHPTGDLYKGLSSYTFKTSSEGEQVCVFRQAPGHGNEAPSRMVSIRSEDFFKSLKREPANTKPPLERLVYEDDATDIRNGAHGVMAGGRWGIISARVNADDSQIAPVFLYSDDEGVSIPWTVVTLPLAGPTVNFMGEIMPFPAAFGGHDTLGFIAYFYESSGIGYYYTVNNGSSWTQVRNVITGTAAFPSVSEMKVIKLASARYCMLIRTSTGLNMAVSLSINMTTWGPLVDSGQKLSSNPPDGWLQDGKVKLLTFSREDRPIIDGYENAMIWNEIDAETLWANAGASGWSGWGVITALPFFPTGYGSRIEARGRSYYLFTLEDFGGSTQSRNGELYMLSSDLVPSVSMQGLREQRAKRNLCWNGGMRLASLGTSFALTTRANTLDGWTGARASNVGGVTVSQRPGWRRSPNAVRVQRDAGNASANAHHLLFVLSEADSKMLADKQVSFGFYARCGANFSAASRFLNTQLRTSADAEQQVTSATGTFTGDTVVGSSNTGVTLETRWQTYWLNPARLAADIRQLMARIVFTPVGTAGADDWYEIAGFYIVEGSQPISFPIVPFDEEKLIGSRYLQSFTVQSENGARHVPLLPQMHRTPTVSVSVGAASSVTSRGFELTHSAAAACQVTAIATL